MWISRGEYRRLLRQLARAEHRAESAQASLDIERHENRRSERHWSNMFLRMRQSGAFPLQPEPAKPAVQSTDTPELEQVPELDAGELAALVEEGKQWGIAPDVVEAALRKEKGLLVN